MEAVGKRFDGVHLLRTGELLAAFAESREHGHAAADDIFHVDFGAHALLIAYDDGGAPDVFHALGLDPEFFGIIWIDGNSRAKILGLRPAERKAWFMFADGCFAFAFKLAVHNGGLPT